MKVADFNYNLPEDLIAQVPIENRDTSRLMVLDRNKKTIDHKIFKDIIDYLEPGDCLVRNNTKVIPARLYGIKEETGIMVEFLLLNRLEAKKKNENGKNEEIWEVMVRPRKAFKTRNKSKLWRRVIKSRNIKYNGWWK
jgi:S-adenosylmethionine:tRNA ribosyltransferase-isomerase